MKFQDWFHSYCLHKTASCMDRDILRWAKPVLEYGYNLQYLTDLEFKGSKRFIDNEVRLNNQEKQITNLKKQIEILEKSNDFYADRYGWQKWKCEDFKAYGGKRARQAQQQLKELREGSEK